MTLPTDGSANVELLHPIFVRRLEALFAHPDLAGQIVVVSGVRTRAQQQALYDCYRRRQPGCNLAANPDQPLGTRTLFGETFTARGSWHMEQPTGFGYAVDVNYSRLGARARAHIEANVPRRSAYDRGAAAPWGLYRTVESPKWEPWHIQPIGDIVTPYDEPEELTMADVAAILAKLDNIDGDIAAVRGKVDAVDNLVAAKITAAVGKLDDRLEAVEKAVVEAMSGGASVVRRGDVRWLLVGNRRHDMSALDIETQIELKNHFGIERDSEQASDEAWAVIESLCDIV